MIHFLSELSVYFFDSVMNVIFESIAGLDKDLKTKIVSGGCERGESIGGA